MQIESLKFYRDLAETESFTKTAQINGVTRSAISQQLSMLERQFKTRLVERSKRTFQLTAEGQVMYDYSKRIVAAQKTLHDRVQSSKESLMGSFRVATIHSIGLHDLPVNLKRLRKSFPTVKVQVEYRSTDQVYEDVTWNVADLGLVAYPGKAAELQTIALRKEPMVLICHPGHPFAKLKSITFKALRGQKFASLEPGMRMRMSLDKAFRAHGVEAQHIIECDNIETVKRGVEAGAGIAIVPQTTITAEVSSQTLRAMPMAGGGLYRPVAAIYKNNRALSPAMRELLALFKGDN